MIRTRHYIRDGKELAVEQAPGSREDAVRSVSSWRHFGLPGVCARHGGTIKPRTGDRIEVREGEHAVAGFDFTSTGWGLFIVGSKR